jgi:hypothetical protein
MGHWINESSIGRIFLLIGIWLKKWSGCQSFENGDSAIREVLMTVTYWLVIPWRCKGDSSLSATS